MDPHKSPETAGSNAGDSLEEERMLAAGGEGSRTLDWP